MTAGRLCRHHLRRIFDGTRDIYSGPKKAHKLGEVERMAQPGKYVTLRGSAHKLGEVEEMTQPEKYVTLWDVHSTIWKSIRPSYMLQKDRLAHKFKNSSQDIFFFISYNDV